MNENFAIQFFEGKQVRIVWDPEKEKYFFSVADIVEIISESKDVKQYVKRMRARDPELNSRWGTICTPTRKLTWGQSLCEVCFLKANDLIQS